MAESVKRPDSKASDLGRRYLDSLVLVERMHRRLLDVIKAELDAQGKADVNSVQALLIFNISDGELTAGELRTRGYYLGSNVSYNLKKLVESGYIHHQRSNVDRRSVRVRLTEKGKKIRDLVAALYARHIVDLEARGAPDAEKLAAMNATLQVLERFWADEIPFGA